MSSLLVLSEILDKAKACVEAAGLAGWTVHFKELLAIDGDELPAVALWILDDTTDDPTPMLGGAHTRKANLVIELRSTMGSTGSIIKTLAPTADAIFAALVANEDFDGLISSLSLKAVNTIGSSENPKYCGLTLQLEAEYLYN